MSLLEIDAMHKQEVVSLNLIFCINSDKTITDKEMSDDWLSVFFLEHFDEDSIESIHWVYTNKKKTVSDW